MNDTQSVVNDPTRTPAEGDLVGDGKPLTPSVPPKRIRRTKASKQLDTMVADILARKAERDRLAGTPAIPTCVTVDLKSAPPTGVKETEPARAPVTEIAEELSPVEQVAGWLGLFIEDGQVVELRALEVLTPGTRAPHTEVGYFDSDHLEDMAQAALVLSLNARGVYFTLNPLDTDLRARSNNRVKWAKRGETATDEDVIRRRFLFFDFDPKRKSGISATKAERAAARQVADSVHDYLAGEGWPEPIVASSGNGYHVHYLIDLQAEEDGLVKRCLQAVAGQFATDKVGVDTSVFNRSRIVRLYGTHARKGDSTSDRPHRRSKIISIPESIQCVPRELLDALADSVPTAEPAPTKKTRLVASAPPKSESYPVARQSHPDLDPHGTMSSSERAARYLATLPDSIEGEDGHNALFRAVCVLVIDFAMEPDQALPILAEWNDEHSDPPWEEKDLVRKLEEAVKKRDEAEPGRVGRLLQPTDEESTTGSPFVGSVGIQPKPMPIRTELLPVPAMTKELLPRPFRMWLPDIASRISCALDYTAVAAIIAVATVVGRKVAIRPKQNDHWTVIPNLWGGIVGRPGQLKTAALAEALSPLILLDKEAKNHHEVVMQEFEVKSLLAKAQADAAKDALKRAVKSNNQEEIEALTKQVIAAELDPPVCKRTIVNDTTVEKLIDILAENPNGLLQFRDEQVGWLKTLDKPGHETHRAFMLEAWNGDGSYTQDRIGRGTIHVKAVCVSLLGGIQPGPLGRYIRAAASGKEDDGLISRFQLLVYPDAVGAWRNVDVTPDHAAKDRALEIFRKLDALDLAKIGATIDERRDDPPFLRFDPEAQTFFDTWRERLENGKLRNEDESPLIESHLAKYRSLMPSLALLFHLIEVVDGETPAGAVTPHSAQMAAAWCDFLEAHVRRIYDASLDGDKESAQSLVYRIRKGSIRNPFQVRWVVQRGWSGLATTEEVDQAVAALEGLDWVRSVEIPTKGRPKTLVFINPWVTEGVVLT